MKKIWHKNLYYKTGSEGNVNFDERWIDLSEIVKLNPQDKILDVGCAEGLIAIQLAKQTKNVDAFDREPYRIMIAKQNADKANVSNINFSVSSYPNFQYSEYDSIFVLGVYHKIKKPFRKKSLYMRVPIVSDKISIKVGVEKREIEDIAHNNGFLITYKGEPRNNHGTLYKFDRR
jgi:SAM-dependent methyltransferase